MPSGRPKPYLKLGARIVEGRAGSGLNQPALARALGVAQQTVSRWEIGTHRPGVDQLPAIASLLNLSTVELLALAGYSPIAPTPFTQPLPLERFSPENFERFVADLVARKFPDANVRRQGDRGHDQDGFDIVAKMANGLIMAFQCKQYGRFGPAEARRAIEAGVLDADEKVLVLSRIASPQTADVVRQHAGWSLWDGEDLSRELRALPVPDQDTLVDIFFPGQREALFGRPEPSPWMDEARFFAPFGARENAFNHEWALAGRDQELAQLEAALDDQANSVIMLSAAAGMGKSRLLKEAVTRFSAARPSTRIYFLSSASDPTRASLDRLGVGRKVLVVDDAHDRDGLGVLMEYAANPTHNATLLLATRPYAEQRIRNDALSYGLTVHPHIALQRLDAAALRSLTQEVLVSFGGLANWADGIVEIAGDNPLVAVLAARVVALEAMPSELAKNAASLKNFVLSRFTEVLGGQIAPAADQAALRDLLEILALIQPFHVEDRRLGELAEKTKGIRADDVTRLLRLLSESGVIFRRGSLHRLMPDLLGDYLIEQSCVGLDGKLSAFVDRVLDHADETQLTNILVNLGRMDWRLAGGDPSRSRLLHSVWRRLGDIENEWDQRLNAVRAVAIYQPAQALAFIHDQIERGHRHHGLTAIVRGIAIVPEYRLEACRLLWELGCDDPRETGPNPSHPIRALCELAGYSEDKPLDFIETIIEFALALTREPDAWRHRFSPLDVLAPALSGQGLNTHGTSRSVTLTPFFVDYDVVQELRAKIIRRLLELVAHSDPAISYRAAAFLETALRHPIGMMSAAPPEELRAKYDAEAAETLEAVTQLVTSGQLRAPSMIAIADAIEWHARHGIEPTRSAAQKLLRALPTALSFRTMAALSQGADFGFRGQVAFDAWDEDTEAETWAPALAGELKHAFPEPEALRRAIADGFADLSASGANVEQGDGLMNALIDGDLAFAKALIDDAVADPSSRTRLFLARAIRQWLRADPDAGRAMVSEMLQNADEHVATNAAFAYVALGRDWTDADFVLVQQALTSDRANVAFAGLRAVSTNRALDAQRAADLILQVQFESAPVLFPHVAMFLARHEADGATLDANRVEKLLARMKVLPKLEGHWAHELLKLLATTHPMPTLAFVLDRFQRTSEDAEADDLHELMLRPGRGHLSFQTSPGALALTWAWLSGHRGKDRYFQYRAAQLFSSLFRIDDEGVLGFFDQKLESANSADLELIGALLRNAHHSFVFKRRAFVERLLVRCAIGGEELVKSTIDQLMTAVTSGVYSGSPGDPMPRDLTAKREAETILAGLSRSHPAYTLYRRILRRADANIAESADQRRMMDEADEE